MTSSPPQSSKQEKKRARAEEKQWKRQERARKKRVARRQQQKRVEAALRPIGATITKRRQTATSSRKTSIVTWYDEEFCFDKPAEVIRWAKRMQEPRDIDDAEMEIARLIEEARREMMEETDDDW